MTKDEFESLSPIQQESVLNHEAKHNIMAGLFQKFLTDGTQLTLIPKSALIRGSWYICDARNFSMGQWTGTSFRYIRDKVFDEYVDHDDHWDDGGTVRPIQEVLRDE